METQYIQLVGKNGIEATYNDNLAGKIGWRETISMQTIALFLIYFSKKNPQNQETSLSNN